MKPHLGAAIRGSVGITPGGDPATAGAATKETYNAHSQDRTSMFAQGRIFASLKVALLAYTLFLSDTAFANAVPEGNGNVGDTASSAGTGGNAMKEPLSVR